MSRGRIAGFAGSSRENRRGVAGGRARGQCLDLISDPIYYYPMSVGPTRKPLAWLSGEIKTPPFSEEARVEAGTLLRRLQEGELLGMPHSRPMPDIGSRCHELRVRDENRIWRVVYRIDPDAIVVAAVFSKTTAVTTKHDIDNCKQRLSAYDEAVKEARKGTRR
jgi:phage-related protein